MSNTPQIRFAGFTDAWEQRELGECMETVTDYVAAGSFADIADHVQYKNSPDYAQLIRTVDLKHEFRNSDYVYVDKKAFDYLWRVNLNEECIVLPNIGANIGEVYYIAPLSLPYEFNVLGPNAILLKTKDSTKFMFTLLQADDFQNKLYVSIASSGQPKFNKTELKSIKILMPQPDEQEKIGAFFSKLDNLITLHQRKCDALQKFKKSMLQKMFPQNGESVPEIRFAGFTDAWEQRKFSELTEIRSASRVHKDEWQSSGVPFYRSSDVMAALNGTENEKAFISEELYEKLSAVSGKLEKGDVLVTGGGSVGKPYIVPNNEPLYTKDADLLWIKNNENLDPYFVYTFFFSPTFTDYLNSVSHVGTIAHYTITQLGETPITLPCVSEQQKIGDYFRNLDFLITLHQRKLETLQKMKKSLLQKMFV